jgi:hypothetical protein
MWWLDSADMVIVLGVIFSGCTNHSLLSAAAKESLCENLNLMGLHFV